MKHVLALAVLVGLVFSFWPASAPVVVTPPKPKSPVAVCLQNATPADRSRVYSFYAALADVLKRNPSAASTVGKFTELHGKSLDNAFKGTDLPGKYMGLDKAINDVLTAAIGTADVALTPERSAALVQALGEVANAAR